MMSERHYRYLIAIEDENDEDYNDVKIDLYGIEYF